MAVARDLTTTTTVAAQLGVSAADARLPHLITTASERLAAWLGYAVERRTITDEDCTGGGPLLKLAAPVQAITTVKEYETTLAATDYVLEADARSKLGWIRRRNGRWLATGRASGGASDAVLYREPTGDLLVTYTAGWWTPGQEALSLGTRDMPAALEEACLLFVETILKRRGQDGAVTSMSSGMAAVSFAVEEGGRAGIPRAVLDVAGPYRMYQRGQP